MGRRVKQRARARVLCLHGYASNGILFRERVEGLLRHVGLEAVAPDGPHEARKATWVEAAASELGHRGAACAWLRDDDGEDDGWAASRRAIQDAVGPAGVAGIVAFSQGCAAAFRLVEEGDVASGLRFVVLVAAPAGAAPTSVPTLHVIGSSDAIVLPGESQSNVKRSGPAGVVFEHEGGHVVPARNPAFRAALAAFVDDALRERSPAAAEVLGAEAVAEVDALDAILGGEGGGVRFGGEGVGDPRSTLLLRLDSDAVADAAPRVWLRVVLPEGYPESTTLRGCARLVDGPDGGGDGGGTAEVDEAVIDAIHRELDALAAGAEGMPMVFDLLTCARDRLVAAAEAPAVDTPGADEAGGATTAGEDR